jgi:hypothetical protein
VVLAAQDTFADGPLVGVNHDADRLTLFRRAGWRCAGGGCGEDLGKQGILFSYRLVGDHGDFTIAPFGDFGTYPCTSPPRALCARPHLARSPG